MAFRLTAALVLLTAGAAGADIQTLSGQKLTGEPIGLNQQVLVIKTADGEIRHPLADILQINLTTPDTPPAGPWVEVELTDGSTLNCSKVEFRPKSLAVVLVSEIALEVPYTAVASICRDAHDPKTRAEFRQFLSKRGQADQVAVRSEGRLNALDGTLTGGLASGDGMEFAIAGSDQKSSPKLARVAGFVFVNRFDPNAAPAICRVTDSARSVLAASNVTWDQQGIDVVTPTGLKVRFPSPTSVAKLDFSRGKLVWLSDLTPNRAEVTISTEDNGNFGEFVRYRADRNIDNGPLRLDGTTYPKGLGLHAGTALVYDLAGDYAQFRAMVGVDETVQAEGQVELIVNGDNRELYRGAITRRNPARPLTLDVKGVQQLRIEVRPVGLLELGGEINLADAKVSK